MNTQNNFLGYGGFWKRFIACCIDNTLVLCFSIATYFITSSLGLHQNYNEFPAIYSACLVLSIFYYVGMESSSRQATLGKMAVGLIVTDLAGNRITALRAIGRYCCKALSTLVVFAGFLMIGWTRKKQALHDLIVRCLVVNHKMDVLQSTNKYDKVGYYGIFGLSIIFSSIFYINYYNKPILPVLKNSLIHFHVPLGLITYSSVLTSSIISIAGLIKYNQFPKIVLKLQFIGVISFLICVVSGSFLARYSWGTYWSWDPIETWALILIYVMIFVLLTIKYAQYKWVWIWSLSIQFAVIILITVANIYLAGLHSSYFNIIYYSKY